MAYIEALFYYIVIVFAVFGLTYVMLLFVRFIVSSFLVYKKGQITIGEYISPSERFVSIAKHKFLKFYTLVYVSAFSFFLIIQSVNYFGSDRAFPKAKAYKIVADVSSFYIDFFIANRNLYYKPSGLKYIEPYEKWQEYLMQKAFQYIPEDDAERAVWRYEYYYANYVRARTAPIDFDFLDKHELKMLLEIGGYTTKYKPIAQEMIQEVGELIDTLMEKPMQDKYYDEVNRYAILVLLTTWWEQKKLLYYTLGVKSPKYRTDRYINLLRSWTNDQKYLGRISKLVDFLDVAKEQIARSKNIRNFLKEHKYIYPDLMALRIRLMANLVEIYLLDKQFSCEIKPLQKYLKYKKEFLSDIAKNQKYKKLNWQEKYLTELFFHNDLEDYILKKYCFVSEDYLTIGVKILDMKESFLKENEIIQRIENER